ncbi:helix-turn-helix transcriptional regulator [Sphingopyxis sp.]|uniref:helix-turn-helix transcriptional regulator n=1 Tax=Sphingopyxis sp. TaxID=1908224 RepID=UPI002FCCA908
MSNDINANQCLYYKPKLQTVDKLEILIQRRQMAPEKIYQVFGRRLADLREEREMTQSDLARRVNLSRASIANIEAGRQRVLLHQLGEFAFALNLSSSAELLPADLGGRALGSSIGPMEDISFTGSELSANERRIVADLVGRFGHGDEDN